MADETTDDESGTDDDTTGGTDWKAEARKWEDRAKKAAAARKDAEDKVRQQTLSENEKAIEAARKEAAENARTEVTTAYQRRLATADLRAAAGGKLTDPADAVRFIDLDDLDLDEDGSPTAKSVTAAIEKLLKEKPYLAADNPRRGTADGGGRGGSKPADMNSLIRQAAGHS